MPSLHVPLMASNKAEKTKQVINDKPGSLEEVVPLTQRNKKVWYNSCAASLVVYSLAKLRFEQCLSTFVHEILFLGYMITTILVSLF